MTARAAKPVTALAGACCLAAAVLAPAPAFAQASADPDTALRAKAWNQVLVWDAPAVRAINLGFASAPLDASMTVLSNRVFLVAAPLAAAPYIAVTRSAQAAAETTATVAAAELLGAGLSEGTKRLFRRPRPYLADPGLRLLPDAAEPSDAFPSGHATVAFAWATVLAHDEPGLAIPAYSLATAIGFSRIYLGVHHPTDILAGLALGFGAGQAVLAGREALRQANLLPQRSPRASGLPGEQSPR